jgi:ferrochelatase
MKTAIILFNLGGPDSPAAVKPFLFNLFNDRAIIGLPQPFRWLLAKLIAAKRAPTAQKIYAEMGGRSPILPNTEAQARALEAALGPGHQAFIVMSYWHPFAAATARDVAAYAPERIVLLPLYPQYSTTTTASSLAVWQREAKRQHLAEIPVTTICCYPTEPGFIAAKARLVDIAVTEAARYGTPRILFSAHGLPEKIIAAGDPYQWQAQQTAASIAAALQQPATEWLNTYQSRVGPLQWIKPATDSEIKRAGAEKRPLVVVPIAFVSEHSETLVELDIEYRHLASEHGVPFYARVPVVAVEPHFIAGLARLVREALAGDRPLRSECGGRICPEGFTKCPYSGP